MVDLLYRLIDLLLFDIPVLCTIIIIVIIIIIIITIIIILIFH